MFTNLYTQKTLEILAKDAQTRLERFAQNMPNGKFWNSHMDGFEATADAIAMQADGTVVLLHSHGYCSINPLTIDFRNRHPYPVVLSTCSCGGTFFPDYNYGSDVDWEKSIEKYNASLFSGSKALVALYVFDKPAEEQTSIPTATVNASMFIIPNSVVKVSDLGETNKIRMRRLIRKLYVENGIHKDPEDEILVQTWMHSEELHCDSMSDHYFSLKINGRKHYFRLPTDYIPLSFIQDKQEGDHIHIRYPVTSDNGDRGEDVDVVFDIDLELNQLKYRYRSFGAFETVLSKLLKNHRSNH